MASLDDEVEIFPTYFKFMAPRNIDGPGTIDLTSNNASDIATAQRELVRIGVDRPTASHFGKLENSLDLKNIRVVKFSDLTSVIGSSEVAVLDVRQVHERRKSFISPSIFIPFYEIESP